MSTTAVTPFRSFVQTPNKFGVTEPFTARQRSLSQGVGRCHPVPCSGDRVTGYSGAPTAGEEVRLADGGQVQGLDGIYPEIGQSPGLIYAAVGRQCFSPSLSSQSSPLSFSLYSTPQLRTNSLNTLWVIGARGS